MAAPQVLIVGAGPTGLVLALRLRYHGVPIRIVDHHSGPGQASRAMAVHARTLEFYEQLGLAQEMVDLGIVMNAMHLWDQGRLMADVPIGNFGRDLSPFPFVLSYPQDDHERFLVEKLRYSGVVVEWDTELVGFEDDGERVRATLRKGSREETCEVAYLCGCDGAHSAVRHGLKLDFAGGAYEQTFYVADVHAMGAATATGGVNMCLNVKDFCLVLPIRSTGMQRLIGIIPDEVKSRENITFDDIRPITERLFGLRVNQVNWFSTYRVHHRVAEHFGQGRAFIAGDAAHIHSPAGGQGMNTGIGDAVNLSWKLAHVLQGRADASLLATYEPERIAFARTLVATTDRAFQIMVKRDLAGRFFRTVLLPYVLPQMFHLRTVRRWMFKTLSQIRITYRGSALSAGMAGDVAGGDRLPWDGVGGSDNFEPLMSLDWQIQVYGDAEATLKNAAAERGIALHVFAWTSMAEKAGLKRDALYLVRPDGHVGLAHPTQDVTVLDHYLAARGITMGTRLSS
ncbi:FAD-dependent monooxygenase [Microvirga alba]|uniref:FAD-dependent monooxygenase n=1 Tax=Microvirga alba TaxID=2791025 RepID=A0A931FN17_9HYPH|nr:FAD-dependent monooxygenase [Microvirga alba]MBF9231832.1 FAD-dependent monooxygenase [Microvirga alba]